MAPATSFYLHKQLGLSKNCAVFDVNHGCAGYPYGLWISSCLIQTGSCRLERPYLGDEKDYEFSPEERVIIGPGTPQLRKKIYEALERRRVNMDNLISAYALVNAGTELGRGNVVAPFCIIPSGAKVGNGKLLNSYASLGHDSKVGHFNVLLFIVQIDPRNNTDRIAGAGRDGRRSGFGQKGEYPDSAGKGSTFASAAPVLLAGRGL